MPPFVPAWKLMKPQATPIGLRRRTRPSNGFKAETILVLRSTMLSPAAAGRIAYRPRKSESRRGVHARFPALAGGNASGTEHRSRRFGSTGYHCVLIGWPHFSARRGGSPGLCRRSNPDLKTFRFDSPMSVSSEDPRTSSVSSKRLLDSRSLEVSPAGILAGPANFTSTILPLDSLEAR